MENKDTHNTDTLQHPWQYVPINIYLLNKFMYTFTEYMHVQFLIHTHKFLYILYM